MPLQIEGHSSDESTDMVRTDLIGGRLKYYLSFWKTLTSDHYILQLVPGSNIEFNCPIKLYKPYHPIKRSQEDKQKMDIEIDKYLISGIIERATHSSGEFTGQNFPLSKKYGGIRIILNLKPLNEDVAYHFKMESLNSVINLTEKILFHGIYGFARCLLFSEHPHSPSEFFKIHVEWSVISLLACQMASVRLIGGLHNYLRQYLLNYEIKVTVLCII